MLLQIGNIYAASIQKWRSWYWRCPGSHNNVVIGSSVLVMKSVQISIDSGLQMHNMLLAAETVTNHYQTCRFGLNASGWFTWMAQCDQAIRVEQQWSLQTGACVSMPLVYLSVDSPNNPYCYPSAYWIALLFRCCAVFSTVPIIIFVAYFCWN